MELNRAQTQMLATLAADMAQVCVASIALPYFLDSHVPGLALLGLVAASFFSAMSLLILKSQA